MDIQYLEIVLFLSEYHFFKPCIVCFFCTRKYYFLFLGKSKLDPVFRAPPKKKKRMMGYKEDPYLFLTETEQIWPSLK